MSARDLIKIDNHILFSIADLKETHAVAIARKISTHFGRKVHISKIHKRLYLLEEHAVINSRLGEFVPERGNNRKRLFKLTAWGQRLLEEVKEEVDA